MVMGLYLWVFVEVVVVVLELRSQVVFKLIAYFRKIWLALKRAVRFSFLEFSIRGNSVPRLFGRSCPSTSWNACTLAMEWQTPWPPPDASSHRPSPLTYMVLPTVHLFALPLTLLTPPVRKMVGHCQYLLRLCRQVSCHFIQLNGIHDE